MGVFWNNKFSKSTKYILIAGVTLISISYFIVYLAAYPGYYCYDCEWFWKFIESGYVSSYQSPLQIVIVTTILKIGYAIFGDWNTAIAIYTFIHMMIMIAFSIWILQKSTKLGAPTVVLILAILFFALNPIIAMFAVCSVKDTIFCMLVLVIMIKIFELYTKIEDSKKTKPNFTYTNKQRRELLFTYFLPIFVCGLIAALYRKNFVFVLILFIIILLFVNRKHLKICKKNFCYNAIMLTICGVIVASFVVTLPVYKLIGVDHENSLVEANCVFAAQVARVADEDDELYQYLKDNARDVDLAIKRYNDNPENTDGYRHLVVNDNNEVVAFAKAWWIAFSKHPIECIEAFGRLTMGAWLPGHVITAYNDPLQVEFNFPESKTSLFNCWTEEPGFSDSVLPELQNWLYQISRFGILESNIFTAWLVSPAVYVWLFIACLIFVIVKRDKPSIISMLLIVCLILSNLMGPCVLVRYYLYLMYGWPIFITMCILAHRRRKTAKDALANPTNSAQPNKQHA